MARHRSTIKPRWRDRPRGTLLRWDLSRGYGLYMIAVGGAWWVAFNFGWDALSGGNHSDGSRIASAGWWLLALAAAVALSWIAWLYLRRPVRHNRDREWVPDRSSRRTLSVCS